LPRGDRTRRELRGWIVSRRAINVKVDEALAATEGFLFAGSIADGWVTMLRAGLAREKYEFFGADALCIDVYDQLQARGL